MIGRLLESLLGLILIAFCYGYQLLPIFSYVF